MVFFMGLFSRSKPKIKIQSTKKDGYSGWVKCTHCHDMVHANELQQNLHCCPKCDYHYRLSATQRVQLLTDEGSFQELFTTLKPMDPLTLSIRKRIKTGLSKRKKIRDAMKGLWRERRRS